MADDFMRWLRLVRPHTDADDSWAGTAAADAALESIHARVSGKPSRLARSRTMIPIAVCGVAATAVVLVTTLSASAPPARTGGRASVPHTQLPALRPAAQTLTPFSTCTSLLAGLRAQAAAHVSADGFAGVRYPSFGQAYSNAITAKGAAPIPDASSTSTTNVQEAGVDEPDIVKTDGAHVVTITDGTLRVIDSRTRAITGTLDLTLYSGWQNAQLLVSGDRAVVLLDAGQTGAYGPFAIGYGGLTGALGKSTALYVDLGGTPTVTGSLRYDGSYDDARLVGSTIRLVATSSPALALPNASGNTKQRLAAYRKAIMSTPLSAWLPSYSVATGSTTAEHSVPCDQVSHPKDYTGGSMVTVYTLDMGRLGGDPQPISVAADGDTVYATQSSLYVASNPQWWCCAPAGAAPASQAPTEIHRFDISGSGRPTYLGSGSVPGRLLSRYSLSEYNGALRAATSTGAANTNNGVYVLDAETLAQEGHLGGLGRGQQIYAVRFLGALGYVVTFRQTDPLYVIDLSDPHAPRVAGSLELNGYSDYLHDAGDGRLIGVGQDANAQGNVAGLQVSLFDVGNGATPTRTSHVVVPGAIGESTLDPHQFLYWAPEGVIAVPTQSWNASSSGRVLVLQLHGTSLRTIGLVANPQGGGTDDQLGIQRSLVVNGELWTLSGGGVRVSDPLTLRRIAWLPFA